MLVIYKTIGSLFLLLSIATLFAEKFTFSQQLKDVKPRIRSWWIILTIFSLALIINGAFLFLLLCFVSFMGLKEFISVTSTRQVDRTLILTAYLAIPIQFYFAWTHHSEFSHFISLFFFVFIIVLATILGETNGMLNSVSKLYWGLVLTTFCLSYLAYLNTVKSTAICPHCGIGLVLYVVVLTQLNDIAQYCWGKLIKGKKILPKISPNKTIAGFLGGIITTMLLSIPLGKALVSFSSSHALLAGGMIAISGFLGDVILSAVKRDVGIKDFSTLIPAHGGMLDRIDSLILAAPVFFYFLKFTHFNGL